LAWRNSLLRLGHAFDEALERAVLRRRFLRLAATAAALPAFSRVGRLSEHPLALSPSGFASLIADERSNVIRLAGIRAE
jgi:hypothetical protein